MGSPFKCRPSRHNIINNNNHRGLCVTTTYKRGSIKSSCSWHPRLRLASCTSQQAHCANAQHDAHMTRNQFGLVKPATFLSLITCGRPRHNTVTRHERQLLKCIDNKTSQIPCNRFLFAVFQPQDERARLSCMCCHPNEMHFRKRTVDARNLLTTVENNV